MCRQLVDRDLAGIYQSGMTADQLYEQYTSFGEDPFIIEIEASAPSGAPQFSGWTYAKKRAVEVASGRPPAAE